MSTRSGHSPNEYISCDVEALSRANTSIDPAIFKIVGLWGSQGVHNRQALADTGLVTASRLVFADPTRQALRLTPSGQSAFPVHTLLECSVAPFGSRVGSNPVHLAMQTRSGFGTLRLHVHLVLRTMH